jgi:DMSO reductase anchor subunit
MSNLLASPPATTIATGSALGAFIGASIASFTGHEDKIERYASRGLVVGGCIAVIGELASEIARLIYPLRAVSS